jgi:hypothetical protein
MYRTRSLEPLAANRGQRDQNRVPLGTTAFDQGACLHSGQLVRETAFIPTHHVGQGLLPHLAFSNRGEAGQNSKLGA